MAGSLRKKGNKYQFEYTYKGVPYYSSIDCIEVKSEKEARNRLEEFCAEVRKGTYYRTSYTFYEFSLIWVREVLTPNATKKTVKTDVNYLNNRILPELGRYNLNEISPLVLTNFINKLKKTKTQHKDRKENKPISKGTIEKIFSIVRAILQKAYEFEYIKDNPCKKVKLKLDNLESEIQKEIDSDVEFDEGEIHFYDRETYNKVLSLLKSEDVNKRTIIETALKTGFRRSEVFGLRWCDVDLEKKEIVTRISRQIVDKEIIIKKLKGKKSRKISIPTSLAELLKNYYKENKNNTYIFEKLGIESICAWFRDWQIEKGIEKIKFHDLRHTHSTLLLLAGVDLKTISERLGHSSIKITMDIYGHFQEELDRKASEVIDEI